jgi:polar amino acid transport system substrate-binding protein
MKYKSNPFWTILVSGTLFALSTLAASAESIKLRADAWMPYNGTEKDNPPGFAIELAKEIFETKGIKVDYTTMPWTDALAAGRAGTIDGIIGAAPAETEGMIKPEEPIGEPRVIVAVMKNNPWKYDALALDSIRLGVINGYSYWDSLDEYINNAAHEPQIVRFTGETPLVDAINQMKEGKIDALPENLAVFKWTVAHMGLSTKDFRIVHVHKNEPIYIAFAKTANGARYAKILDEGIRSLRASGQLEKLLSKYDMTDWK